MVEVSDSRMETFDPIYGVGLQEMRDSLSAERHVLLDDIRHNWYYGWDSEGKPKSEFGRLSNVIFTDTTSTKTRFR